MSILKVGASVSPGDLASEGARHILAMCGLESVESAIILGSGWGEGARHLGSLIAEIDAQEIPGFTRPNVPGHSGKIQCIETPEGKITMTISARAHLYEQKTVGAVVHPVRVAAASGARVIVLTNGAGAIRRSLTPGQIVLISDHINLTLTSPIEGANFVDLTDVYSERLREKVRKIDPTLEECTYVQFRGPNYETPAEVRMAEIIGGDVVGMSTALEAIAAREAGMEVVGLSLITNLAAGVSAGPLSHQEVLDAGRSAENLTTQLLGNVLRAL